MCDTETPGNRISKRREPSPVDTTLLQLQYLPFLLASLWQRSQIRRCPSMYITVYYSRC